ncbi:MAG: hypothetical protein QW117_03160 [Candidatus Pacearchaeota archaeon]
MKNYDKEKKEKMGFCITLKAVNLFYDETKKSFSEISKIETSIEKFLRNLEKSMHEVIWYIGIDFINDKICERFMFSKSGFMEIYLMPQELNIYVTSKEKMNKLYNALKKTLIKLKKTYLIKEIKIK